MSKLRPREMRWLPQGIRTVGDSHWARLELWLLCQSWQFSYTCLELFPTFTWTAGKTMTRQVGYWTHLLLSLNPEKGHFLLELLSKLSGGFKANYKALAWDVKHFCLHQAILPNSEVPLQVGRHHASTLGLKKEGSSKNKKATSLSL